MSIQINQFNLACDDGNASDILVDSFQNDEGAEMMTLAQDGADITLSGLQAVEFAMHVLLNYEIEDGTEEEEEEEEEDEEE